VNRDSGTNSANGGFFHGFELAPDANRYQANFSKQNGIKNLAHGLNPVGMNGITSQTQTPRAKNFTENFSLAAFLFRGVRVFRGSPK
jgi:hypothetical protein